MNRIFGRSAAVGALAVLAASFTVVLAADPDALDPEDAAMLERAARGGAGVAAATAAGCTVATADRATTPVADCTSCHGGADANQNFQMPGGHEFGHPVNIDFEAARSGNPDSYFSRDQLPVFLPLAEGKITCLTCHDGRAGNRHSLAKASQKEMCLACHRM
jgi:predicted CXXCH cytochrome family protein